jgi:hypothetical protein
MRGPGRLSRIARAGSHVERQTSRFIPRRAYQTEQNFKPDFKKSSQTIFCLGLAYCLRATSLWLKPSRSRPSPSRRLCSRALKSRLAPHAPPMLIRHIGQFSLFYIMRYSLISETPHFLYGHPSANTEAEAAISLYDAPNRNCSFDPYRRGRRSFNTDCDCQQALFIFSVFESPGLFASHVSFLAAE